MSWLDNWFLPKGAEETQRQVNERQAQILADQVNRGVISQGTYDDLNAQIAGNTYDNYFLDPANSPTTAFGEELAHQAQTGGQVGKWIGTLADGIRNNVNSIVGNSLKAIPWWVWVGAALFALWRLGLLGRLLRKAAS